MDHPVLVLKKQGGKRAGINKKTGNYFTSRWQLDMAPFLEVITLSKHYLHEWNAGQPRFEEWRESVRARACGGPCVAPVEGGGFRGEAERDQGASGELARWEATVEAARKGGGDVDPDEEQCEREE